MTETSHPTSVPPTAPPAEPVGGAPLREQRGMLRVVLALTALALAVILAPFYGALLWAVIIALLFAPMQRWLRRRLRGNRTLAALLTVLVVLLIVVLPLLVVGAGLMSEVNAFYEGVQSGAIKPATWVHQVFERLPPAVTELLDRLGIGNERLLERKLQGLYAQLGQFLAQGALSYGQHTVKGVAALFVMLYVAFFLLRDGAELAITLNDSLPLAPRHKRLLRHKFKAVIRATVKGNLLVALLQGGLGGLAFWVLGLPGALVATVLMMFLSLLPAIGAALVWAPMALFLLIDGRVAAGLGLMAWGTIVIGLVDNLLRPVLVGQDTRLPDWVVLMTTVGGMAVFGVNGFVIGPLIAAMFFAVWDIALSSRGDGARRSGGRDGFTAR